MKMNTVAKKEGRSPRVWIISSFTLLLICGIGYYIWSNNRTVPASSDGINYAPATEEDKRYNDEHKAELDSKSPEATQQQPAAESVKKQVTPTITAYGQPGGAGTDFRLNGFVPGTIESDGTCTLTLTKNGASATASKAALQNVQDTSCGQLVIPFSQLSSGSWRAVLSYESSSSKGISVAVEVDIK